MQEFRFIDIERSMNAINRLIKIPINVIQLLKSTNWNVIKEIIKEGKKKKKGCAYSRILLFARKKKLNGNSVIN